MEEELCTFMKYSHGIHQMNLNAYVSLFIMNY